MANDLVSAVGRTAMAVAAARVVESRRSDAWFTDPLAEVLFSERAVPDLPGWLIPSVATRTRFLDDVVLAAPAAGPQQVVIVGAGLDARAFRLTVPGETSVFEVDRDDILTVKAALVEKGNLTPICRRTVVAADITEATWLSRLQDAGWIPDHPTIWVLEGLLVYFDQAFRVQLLSALAKASAPGSVLGATMSSQRGQVSHPLWFPAPEVATEEWMSGTGWQAKTITSFEASARYGRPVPAELTAALRGELVEATNS